MNLKFINPDAKGELHGLAVGLFWPLLIILFCCGCGADDTALMGFVIVRLYAYSFMPIFFVRIYRIKGIIDDNLNLLSDSRIDLLNQCADA